MPHEAPAAGVLGMIVPVVGILIFHGSVYVLVALNLGWRFGYWVTGACFGALLVALSLFWTSNALGPRGEEPRWFPIASTSGQIQETTFNGKTFKAPAGYPAGPWKSAGPALTAETDSLKASLSNCLSFSDSKVQTTRLEIAKLGGPTRTIVEAKIGKRERSSRELDSCKKATSLLPAEDQIPKVDNQSVAVVYDATQIRFTRENGVLLAEATMVPNTYDKRVTGDPSGTRAKSVGKPVRIVAYKDAGSLRLPSFLFLGGSLALLAFHLAGLSRAERRRLSPVAA